jgi:hypothetical protein
MQNSNPRLLQSTGSVDITAIRGTVPIILKDYAKCWTYFILETALYQFGLHTGSEMLSEQREEESN